MLIKALLRALFGDQTIPPAKQVQQPMCLHKTYWRGLGADLPTVPPTFNSHFTRTALYIPAPGMPSWECDRRPGDVFTWLNGDTSRDGLTKVTGDCRAGVPTLKLQAQFVWPGVRWSNACWTGHHHADGRKSSLLARCWFAHAGQMSARQDKTMNMVNPCAVE